MIDNRDNINSGKKRERLIARYAIDRGEYFELVTRFSDKTVREQISANKAVAESIMPVHPAAIWFERKISDDFGIYFEGAFDHRPLVHQERFPLNIHPMRKEFDINRELEFGVYRPYKYESIGGDGVFEVAVGPIHAGIIEPGHFQFSQAGEDMLHQEVRHFYKYRGIEKMLEGMNLTEAAPIVARISGNESVASQIALRDIILKASGVKINDGIKRYHALLLELERVIHHWTDLGFIPNDAGFGAALAFASARAEESRRIMNMLTGHRFGFDAVFKNSSELNIKTMREWINKMKKHISWFEAWISDIPSLWDRFDTTGILKFNDGIKYACVGVVARSSGIAIDRRGHDSFYKENGFLMALEKSGDVAARFKIRIAELKNSLDMMNNFLKDEKIQTFETGKIQDGEYESFAESSIGEIYMAVEIKDGVINRFFMRDPSFINWQALHLMMPGNIIADFPLINKSCDLSYAGNDL